MTRRYDTEGVDNSATFLNIVLDENIIIAHN